jgi:FkbM family methyltransferase
MQFIARIVRPDDIAVDVGGHIGYIGQYLATLVGPKGHVYCFEPGSNNYPYTAKNLGVHSHTTLFQKGVGDACGQLELVIENLSGQNNSVLKNYECLDLQQKSQGLRADAQVQLIDVVTLDSLMDDVGRIDFVKVDVEGYEWPVLKGAQRLLSTQSPAITVEMQFDRTEQFENLASHGYRLFSPALREIKSVGEFAPDIENVFGLHKDRHAALLSELS